MESIDLAHITPANHASLLHGSRIAMALETYCKINVYAKAYQDLASSGTYVILDNNMYETGKSCDIHQLIKTAKKINAKMIILPDGLTESTYDDMKRARDAELHTMVVPTTLEEMFQAVHSEATLIGLSYMHANTSMSVKPKDDPAGRLEVLNALYEEFHDFDRLTNRIHLLGLTVPGELALVQGYRKWISSCDTSIVFQHSIHHRDLIDATVKFPIKVKPLDDAELDLTRWMNNLIYLQNLANPRQIIFGVQNVPTNRR